MNQQTLISIVNPREAPHGFYAVLKSQSRPEDGSNICRACDWRPTCQKPEIDKRNHNHRCMDYAVIADDGTCLRREDGCSVVFLANGGE